MPNPQLIPTLSTARLTLRPLAEADAPALLELLGTGDVLRYFPNPAPPDRARVDRIISHHLGMWAERGLGWWALELCSRPGLIGCAGLEYLPETGETEVAYLLGRDYWGQGLATEAARAALNYAFDTLGLQTIIGLVHPENLASSHVLEKLGLTFVDRSNYFGMELNRYRIARLAAISPLPMREGRGEGMRTEQEMYDLILNIAKADEHVRAVFLNGSRANPNARRDFFQDFDIVYVVSEVGSLTADHSWIKCFGDMMIFQMPDAMGDDSHPDDGRFAYLMQFMDGNRIDLTLFPVASLSKLEKDSLSVLLLDKDGLIQPFAPASEEGYLPQPPTAKEFFDCCNEFWWVSPYVAKGLWRGEIIYAQSMFHYVREQLMKMLAWHIGVKTGFAINPGKYGKHFQRHLEPELWAMLEQTYSDANYDRTWDAHEMMCRLFRLTASRVAAHFGFDYPFGDDERVSAHLKHVRSLPKDAAQMY